MKPITVWKKFNKKKQKYKHNHIENEHVSLNTSKPIGTSKQTKMWEKDKWISFHKHLNNKQKII